MKWEVIGWSQRHQLPLHDMGLKLKNPSNRTRFTAPTAKMQGCTVVYF